MGRKNALGLPEHLRQRPNGNYYLDYYLIREGGKRKRVREEIGPVSKTLAKAIRDTKMAELAKQDYKVQAPKISFRQAAEDFLEYSRSRKRAYSRDVQLVRRLVEHFGDQPLESLSSSAFEKFLNMLKAKGKRISCPKGQLPKVVEHKPATLNRYMACAKTIVNKALANRKIDRNPLYGLKLFKENNARDRVLSQEEFSRLVEECPEHIKLIVRMAYITAMRQGEILKLRWDQVDLKAGVIKLAQADTKTAEAREVPLTPGLVQELQAWPRVLRSPFVFTYEGRSMASIKTGFKAACTRAGIENFRFHDLRHCAVTNLRKSGVPTGIIMSISGHKTDAMMRRYDRVDREDRIEALAKVRHFLDTRASEAAKTA